MGKKLLLCILTAVCYFCINGYSQTTTQSYSFSAFSSTYSSISATGTVVPALATYDATQVNIPIGFTFYFCGVPSSQLSASTKGWVSLVNSPMWWWATWYNSAWAIPVIAGSAGTGGNGGLLFPFWEDLDGYLGHAYYMTTGSAPNRVFTMEWKNSKHIFVTTDSGNFQVKLYEGTNVIDFCYGTGAISSSAASIGIGNNEIDYRTLPNSGTSPTPSSSPSGTFTSTISTKPADGQVYRWTPCPVTVSASNSGAVCPGGTVTLYGATTGSSYTWTGPGGYSSGTLTPSLTGFTPTMSGTYSLTATNGTCTVMATTFASNAPIPPVPVLTPTATAICNGSSVAISASGGTPPTTLLSQDFNTTMGGWTVTNLAGVPASYWQLRTPPGYSASPFYAVPGDGSQYLEAVPVATWITSTFYSSTHTLVTSPTFSTLGYSGATLNFNQYYWTWAWWWFTGGSWGDISAAIQYSIDGGSTWNTIIDEAATASTTGTTVGTATWSAATPTTSVALPAGAIGMPNVKLRWNYYSYWSYLWAIDNINVIGTPYTVLPATWTPSTDLFTDPGFTTPYTTGTPAGVVYVHPTTITASTVTTYTATITSALTCVSSSTSVVTVNPAVPAITGNMTACTGYTTTLFNSVSGGTWSSSTPGVASVGSLTGIVTGLTPGTALINYTVSGCSALAVVTVTAFPGVITGVMIDCMGATTTLSNSLPGGTWSSGSPGVATVGSSTGVVSGVSLGTTIITYSMGNGCQVTAVVTVNPFPNPITGSAGVCIGASTPLSSTTPGGIWLSSAPGTASVGIVSGVVNGISLGTAIVSYRVAGCAASQIMTVVPTTAPIVGPTNVCIGYPTIMLTDITPGGSWSSSSTSIATVGSSTGIVTGGAAGTTTITYSFSPTCLSTKTVTVLPAPAAITGTPSMCQGTTTTLFHPDPAGTWSSSDPTVATVGLGTGLVSGVITGSSAPATAMITYTLASGCTSMKMVTVNPLPAAIGGSLNVCEGATSTLTNSSTGGTWSSSSPSVATIDITSGVASGILAGTTTISYSIGSGCAIAAVLTVNALPSAISGAPSVCSGNNTPFTSLTGGGAWITSDPLTADVAGSGLVSGIAAGVATISYVLPTGCQATKDITVTTSPPAITGSTGMCIGYTTTLSNSMPGGTWSSVTPPVATITSSGVVSGLTVGTSVISYTAFGCATTVIVSVNSLPAPISGPLGVCVNSTTALSDATTGGTWSSSTTAYGTINTTTGAATGISAPGTTTITYTLGSGGCFTTATLTINALPAVPGGSLNVCSGSTTTLSSTPGGGTWSSGSPGIASVGLGSGIVTGGTVTVPSPAVITYVAVPTGCSNNVTITVNPLPASITGASSVCVGNTTSLSTITTGATWTSSSPGTAAVFPTTGAVTGNAAGTATITCYGTAGCYRTTVMLVNPLPAAISGPAAVCEGSTVNEASAPLGGTWTSTTTSAATVGLGSGTVAGIAAPGTTTVIYTLGTGCAVSKIISVNPLPGAITGTANMCIGTTTTLNGTPTGGTWASSSAAIASVGAGTGIVTGMGTTTATATITYTLGTGCKRTIPVTVYALPGPITGPLVICSNSTATLGNSIVGGTWASSNPAVASIALSSGFVTGVSGYGTTIITYTLGSGCNSQATLTVNPAPAAITGILSFSEGGNTNLSSAPTGGTWSSSSPSVGTIDPVTGVMYGVSGGTSTVTYILPTGCRVYQVVTVNPLPGVITGGPVVCAGANMTLSCSPLGGTWTSSNTMIADIGAGTGIVTAYAAGTSTITYTLPTGTIRTYAITVNALPAPITGATNICVGSTTALTDGDAGGTWSSTAPTVGTVGASTGIAGGVSSGFAMISYTLPTGCSAVAMMLVNPLPGAVTGTLKVCENATTTLSCTPPGGTWSTASPNVTVSLTTGAVTGNTAGTSIVTYATMTGCKSTAIVTIDPMPSIINGSLSVCLGLTSALTDATGGGIWASSDPLIAPITSGGVVSGSNMGNAIISYTNPVTGCIRTAQATVNPLPATITGSSGFCNLTSTTMSSLSPGGTWSSLNTGVAAIGATTGVVTGVSVDTVSIVYTLPTGCATSKQITIILAPYPTHGDSMLCNGQTATLTNTIGGGTWTSTVPGIASIGLLSGITTGNSLGTAVITYVLSTGCYSAFPVTVNPSPGLISGATGVCVGLTANVFAPLSGGNWSSSNTTVASVDAAAGIVTGGIYGTTVLTYTMPTGCASTSTFTVNPLPGPINGSPFVCEGSTINLTDTSAGGTWTSGSPGIVYATLSTGAVTGMSAGGTAKITYTLGTGCITTKDISVNPIPLPVTGIATVCVGNATTVNDASPGGSWESSNTSLADINSSGSVTGVSAGIATISYKFTTGCAATRQFTVNPNPVGIAGALAVCAGFSTNLTDATPGGNWISDPTTTSIGTINHTTGVVTGITPGIIPVTYTLGTGCRISNTVTVILLPAVISGSPNVCVGQTSTLTNPIPGGVWSSSNTAKATVDASSGLVTGVSAGAATITYMVGTGCYNVLHINVNPLPSAITGPSQVCEGSTITLADASTPGSWQSGDPSIATISSSTGVLTGVSGSPSGIVTISYSLLTGCVTTRIVTVNVTPPAITGSAYICQESTVLMGNTMAGGVWHSSNPAVATIGPSSGIVTPVTLGTSMVSYTLSSGCQATKQVTVSPLPNVYSVTGGGSYCASGNGVPVGLNGSQPGVSYVLYYGSSATGYHPGTGLPFDFGSMSPAGTYTVQATYALSGCTKAMTGSAAVVITPLNVPEVTISTGASDVSCPGDVVHLTPIPVYGGSSPSYMWKINGVGVGAANSYSFVPADGDIATVTMISNDNCISGTVASGSRKLVVLPTGTPQASIAINPGDTVCEHSWATFTALPVYGGSDPVYTWMVNGVNAGTGYSPSFAYVPVDGDQVNVLMASNYQCRTANFATSSKAVMTVDPLIIPHVSVVADSGLLVTIGQQITLHAITTNAGQHPSYQWKVNGYPVPGATSDSYTSTYHDYDSVTCIVTSDGVCKNIGTFDWVFISVAGLGVQSVGAANADIRILPNPNNGTFSIKGTTGATNDETFNLEITDMLGQVIYRGSTTAVKGRINEQITLSNTLANGMYLLTVNSSNERMTFHFIIEE